MYKDIQWLHKQLELIRDDIISTTEDIRNIKDNIITKDDIKELEAGLNDVIGSLNDSIDKCISKINRCSTALDKLHMMFNDIPTSKLVIHKPIRKAYVEYYQNDDGEIRPIEYRYYR